MKHNLSYKPVLPHPRLIRTRGEINNTALIIIWLSWVWTIELRHMLGSKMTQGERVSSGALNADDSLPNDKKDSKL